MISQSASTTSALEAARSAAGAAVARFRRESQLAEAPSTFDAQRIHRRVAMGDPQAPFEKVLAILHYYRLLGPDGFLQPDVQLFSMGDHFDWGAREDRPRAAEDAMRLLCWLAAHPREQVVLLAGNHDLTRVGELAAIDDVTFQRIQDEADAIYFAPESAERNEREHAFLARYPAFPSTEVVSRDCGTFRAEQRTLVTALLGNGRFVLAAAPRPQLLLTHSGVTVDDLTELGLPAEAHSDARAVAARLNESLTEALCAADGGRLIINHLHHPGDAAFGEGRGILFHRPAHPEHDDALLFQRPWARRFDPRRLPRGLVQAVGHIHDAKCRSLLGSWADEAPPKMGVLRHLRADRATVHYAHGVPAGENRELATMLFLDGRMLHCEAEAFELLDLDTLQPLRR